MLQIPNTSRQNGALEGAASGHHNHFHVFLSPPQRVDLPRNLLADDAASGAMQAADSASLQVAAQAMLNEFQPDFGFEEGEVTMFIMDMPDVPPQYAQVMLVQVAQLQQTKAKYDRVIGVCQPVEDHDPAHPQGLAMNSIEPVGSTKDYFYSQEKKTFEGSSTVTVLEMPKHGRLEDRGTFVIDHGVRVDTGERRYRYLPSPGFVEAKDRAVLLVEIAGMKIKMVYTFHVVDAVGNFTDENFCGSTPYKRLSAEPELAPLAARKLTQSWSLVLSGIPTANVAIADLPSSALGQTTGQSVTLDTNAAGHGWYIDYTPWLNEEYLPTANPNVWQAKEGSDAAGKMDMLSVLLHEYGHVLGIEHSADAHAAMAATLTPGTRRLPSADELALMSQLVSDVKAGLNNTPETPTSPIPLGTTLGGLWLARLRKSAPGETVTGTTANTDPSAMPQYSVAAHATLTNPGFTGGAGWSTTGTITFDSTGTATLSESATAQTRLNQIFVLGAQDRFLRFTLDNIALDDVNGAPDDAFEVALIDANTGLSLLGSTGLTRNDALLNLQANGTEYLAPTVTRTLNADGSRTYLVDLSSVVGTGSAGAAVVASKRSVRCAHELCGCGIRRNG